MNQPLLGTRLDGADLHFSFVKEDGQLQAVQVRVQGGTMAGEWVGGALRHAEGTARGGQSHRPALGQLTCAWRSMRR